MFLVLKQKIHFTPRKILRATTALFSAQALALTPAACYALPTGGQVSGGDASIRSNANTMNINQATSKAIIDWSTFNIGSSENVIFQQPSAAAIALNRIHDSNPSQIMGNLFANGQVWLLNSNGVMFGQNAQVNVASLLVSTANISNENFMAGNFVFDQPGNANASITNAGSVTVAEGGLAAFVAPTVVNSGAITARLGRVQLASGDQFTLDLYGDGLINIVASSALTFQLVQNSGRIQADGGRVMLTAAAAQGVVDSMINMNGFIQANSIGQEDGAIILYAAGRNAVDGNIAGNKGQSSNTSTVLVSGSMSVTSSTGEGGLVEVLGDHVGLMAGTNIDASGKTGGGVVHIGGDYHGEGATPTALANFVQDGATIKADALDSGDGGKVTVWADDYTNYAGNITARGGAQSGNGGFVETSGKQVLDMHGNVNASSAHGNAGTWQMDPNDLIVNGAADTNSGSSPNWVAGAGGGNVLNTNINTALNAGTDVTLTASGNITISSAITQSASPDDNTITLAAGGDIIVNAAITSSSHKLNMIFDADSDASGAGAIAINANVTSNGGNITMGGGVADPTTITAGVLNADGTPNTAATGFARGDATLTAGIFINGVTLNAGTGNITMNGTGYGAGAGSDRNGVYITSGTVQTSGGTISLSGNGGATSGGINSGVDIEGSTVSVGGGALVLIGTGGTDANSYDDGIYTDSSTMSATGTGTITMNGTGGGSGAGGNNIGVAIGCNGGACSTVGVVNGNLTIVGTGSNTSSGGDHGVFIAGNSGFATYVQTTGSGNVSITGTATGTWGGSNGSVGVYLFNLGTVQTTSTGNISITGYGSTAGGIGAVGIYSYAGNILSTNATGNNNLGKITLNGTGGNSTGDNSGIVLEYGTISTVDGAIFITGNGGVVGSGNAGVIVGDGNGYPTISATGIGTINLTGNGGLSGGTNNFNSGIVISQSGTVVSTNSGTLTITGTGGTGSAGSNEGFELDAAAVVSSTSGAIQITGIKGAGASDSFFTDNTAGNKIGNGTSGNITLIADDMNISSLAVNTTNNVYIQPQSQNGTIAVSGAAAGNLAITTAILGDITAANTYIGRTDGTGLMRVKGADLSADTFGNLFLQSGSANIQFDGGGTALTLANNKSFSADTASGAFTTATAVGTITTNGTGNINIADAMTLGQNLTLNSAGTVTFGSTVNGGHNLTASAGTFGLGGALGGNTPLSAVSLASASTIALPAITASTVFARSTDAAGDLTLNGVITASGAGDAIVLVSGRNFINNAGASALTLTGGGRWIGYSNKAADDTNGLVSAQIINGKNYGNLPPGSIVPATYDGTQNTWVYNVASGTITLTAVNQTVTYGTTPNTTPTLGVTFIFSCSDGCLSSVLTANPGTISISGGTSTSGNYTVAGPHTISLSQDATDNNGYTINYATGTLTVNQKSLNVTGLTGVVSKAYDGTNAATIAANGSNYPTDKIVGDTVNFTSTATYNNPNVGLGKAVTVSALSIAAGGDGANYNLVTAPPVVGNVGSITALAITLTASDQTHTYGFGGNSAALGTTGFALTAGSYAAGEAATAVTLSTNATGSGSGNYNTDAYNGNAPWTLTPSNATGSGGFLASNYTITYANATTGLTINKLAATITGVLGANKVYDSTTADSPNNAGEAISSKIAGDAVGISNGNGTFGNANVGNGKVVTFSGYSLTGGDANDYNLTGQPANGTANITAASLTITAVANTKTYDSTTSAAGTPTVSGLQGGSDSVTGLAEAYTNANFGIGNKTETVTAYTVNDGNGGNNYSVTLVANNTGTINKEALTITAGTNTKTYDGTTSAAAVPTITAGALHGSDTANFLETYASRNAGNNLTLTPSGNVADGNSGLNYSYTFVNDLTGVINKATLTLTAVANTKIYDSTTGAVGTPTVAGLQAGDTVTGLLEAYSNPNFGSGNKTETVTAYTVNDGNSGNNYNVNTVANNTGTINKAALSVTATDQTRTYGFGGNSAALGTTSFTSSGLVGSETIGGVTLNTNDTTSTSGNYIVGTYTLTPSAAAGGTFTAGNYSISYDNAATGLTVTPKSFSVTGLTAHDRPYDGTTTAPLSGVAVITGADIVVGDVVTLNGTVAGNFATANGGAITLSGLSLVNTDGANYIFSGQNVPPLSANVTGAPAQTKSPLSWLNIGLQQEQPCTPLSRQSDTMHKGKAASAAHCNGAKKAQQ